LWGISYTIYTLPILKTGLTILQNYGLKSRNKIAKTAQIDAKGMTGSGNLNATYLLIMFVLSTGEMADLKTGQVIKNKKQWQDKPA